MSNSVPTISLVSRPVYAEAMYINDEIDEYIDDTEITFNDWAIASASGWLLANGVTDFKVFGERRPFGIQLQTSSGYVNVEPGEYIVRIGDRFYGMSHHILYNNFSRMEDL